jgi:excisionase family DNA binding protein
VPGILGRHERVGGPVSSMRTLPGDGPVRITVRKISGSEIQVSVCADIRVSGDLAQLLPPGAYPAHPDGEGNGGYGLGGRELLTVEQAAEVLNISRDHVYGLLRSGELGSIKIGKLRRISRQRIADFIGQQEASTPRPQAVQARHGSAS